MPRPPYKRAKVNHSTPIKRAPSVARKVLPISLQELQQKLAHKKLGHALTDSDDSDRLVTSNRNGRNRRGVLRKEVFASGGVASGDAPGAHTSQGKSKQNSQNAAVQQPMLRAKINNSSTAQNRELAEEPAATHPRRIGEQALRKVSPSLPIAALKQVGRAPIRTISTPVAETSILGTIKPRRRQPSILRLIENNESSIADGDEIDFLTNDESTPIHPSKTPATTLAPNSSLLHQSLSRKRKLSQPITLVYQPQEPDLRNRPQRSPDGEDTSASDSDPELPSSRAATVPPRVRAASEDTAIMAPPQSSSPLQSPSKSRTPSPAEQKPLKHGKKPVAPSTIELQALMPTRRKRKARERTSPRSEFDIPADTDSMASHGQVVSDEDDASFNVQVKGRKSKVRTRTKGGSIKTPRSAQNQSKGRASKSTISPIKAVTPLKRPSAHKSAAKSFLSQQPGTDKVRTTYYSRHLSSTGDKENQPVDMSEDFSLFTTNLEDNSIEESVVKDQPSKELQKLARTFADVDGWEMEYEDVTVGGSSSPNRR